MSKPIQSDPLQFVSAGYELRRTAIGDASLGRPTSNRGLRWAGDEVIHIIIETMNIVKKKSLPHTVSVGNKLLSKFQHRMDTYVA